LKAHPYRAFKTLLRREHWRASLPNFHLAMQIVLLTLFFVPLHLRPHIQKCSRRKTTFARSASYCVEVCFQNGQMVERWGSSDQLGILQQLGADPVAAH